ncbi:MAG: hypothetical protein R2932_39410 [Caldilineaceae bacterium]
MTLYILKRFLRGLITMWLVVTVVFVVLRMNGDPAAAMLPDEATTEEIAAFNRQHGLDKPIAVQYGIYVTNILRGEFGSSLGENRPVTELIARASATRRSWDWRPFWLRC